MPAIDAVNFTQFPFPRDFPGLTHRAMIIKLFTNTWWNSEAISKSVVFGLMSVIAKSNNNLQPRSNLFSYENVMAHSHLFPLIFSFADFPTHADVTLRWGEHENRLRMLQSALASAQVQLILPDLLLTEVFWGLCILFT